MAESTDWTRTLRTSPRLDPAMQRTVSEVKPRPQASLCGPAGPQMAYQNAASEDDGDVGSASGVQDVERHKPWLTNLPREILLKICKYSVAHDSHIYPSQIRHRSNKFDWRPHHDADLADLFGQHGQYSSMDSRLSWKDYEETKPLTDCSRVRTVRGLHDHTPVFSGHHILTYTSLLLTCRAINDLITQYPVFYEVNTFVFSGRQYGHEKLRDYVFAIRPERRQAIRHVIVSDGSLTTRHAIPLSQLTSLRSLTIALQGRGYSYVAGWQIADQALVDKAKEASDAFEPLLRSSKGLAFCFHLLAPNVLTKDLPVNSICVHELPTLASMTGNVFLPNHAIVKTVYDGLQTAAKKMSEALAKAPDGKAPYPKTAVVKHMRKAMLDILGETRETRNKETGGVTSRTRKAGGQVGKQNKYGVIFTPKKLSKSEYTIVGIRYTEATEVKLAPCADIRLNSDLAQTIATWQPIRDVCGQYRGAAKDLAKLVMWYYTKLKNSYRDAWDFNQELPLLPKDTPYPVEVMDSIAALGFGFEKCDIEKLEALDDFTRGLLRDEEEPEYVEGQYDDWDGIFDSSSDADSHHGE